MTVQILCQIHHTIVIRVCLIELHQSKLRIVTGIKSLIAEYPPDLVYTLHSSDNQTFQIKLQRNPQLKVLVQCIEVGLKRSGRRSAGVCHEHRCLHFQESLAVQIFPDTA